MKIETKFNEGDVIFFIHDGRVIKTNVRGFTITRMAGVDSRYENEIVYLCSSGETPTQKPLVHVKVNEKRAYATKEDLLKSL